VVYMYIYLHLHIQSILLDTHFTYMYACGRNNFYITSVIIYKSKGSMQTPYNVFVLFFTSIKLTKKKVFGFIARDTHTYVHENYFIHDSFILVSKITLYRVRSRKNTHVSGHFTRKNGCFLLFRG